MGWVIPGCLLLLPALLLMLIPAAVAAPVINEIMYNPNATQGDDPALEWIELESAGEADLSNYQLDGKKLNGSFSGYVILARNKEKFFAYYGALNCSVFQASMVLSNDEEVVVLGGGSYEEIVAYTAGLGANGNGKTLERNASGSFLESLVVGGTPCQNNSVLQLKPLVEQPLSSLLAAPQNTPADSLPEMMAVRIISMMPNPDGNDDGVMPGGEWVEVYNLQSNPVELQGWMLQDEDGHVLRILANNTASLALQPSGSMKIYRNGNTRFSLNNDADAITLVDALGRVVDTASYTGSREGRALRKIDASWVSEELPGASSSKTKNPSGSSKKKTSTTLPLLIGTTPPKTTAVKSAAKSPTTTSSSTTLLQNVAGEIVYASPQAAAGKSGMYFFIFTLVILVVVLVFRKDF